MMSIRIEEPNGEKRIEDYTTNAPVTIRTPAGVIVVGVFNDEIQVVRIQGDLPTTMVKFNDRSLL